ncbi:MULTISPECIES: YesL family protein [Bacillaceae]|uniref:YesL family protein n=1 Tax=Bacillaceae TaxID=186817 RepID=UPI001E2D18D9|nr:MULTISPECIES: YesL family protein [Bacillaceae]MCE4049361.1 YesL family protein [Bacillus sp. Au-Bac7]MCM3032382.1 YesL family protein [Niallia sp. MER 6]UPO90221.1 YesL family protein [Niallia sp. Man26]
MKKGSSIIVVCEWIWRGIFVNLCWIAFIVLGLGIFGFFPATVALFTIVRKWLRKDTDFPIWKTFKQVYLKEWKRSNQIGLVFYSIGLFLYLDIRLTETFMSGVLASFLSIIFSIMLLILLLVVSYFFAVYVHYELSNKEYIKQSFLITLTSLPSTIGIGAGFFVIGSLINQMPGLIPFISAVAPAFWMMKVCLSRFAFLESRVQQQY